MSLVYAPDAFCLCKAYAGRHSRTLHIDSCRCSSADLDTLLASVDSNARRLVLLTPCCHPGLGDTTRYRSMAQHHKGLMILFVIVLYHTPTTRRGRYVNIRDSVPSARQQSKLSHSHQRSCPALWLRSQRVNAVHEHQPFPKQPFTCHHVEIRQDPGS